MTSSDSTLSIILHASPVVQVVFFLLVALSIVSWAIIFAKWKQFGGLKRAQKKFWEIFHQAKSLEEIFASHKPTDGPFFRLFYIGFASLVGPSKRRGTARDYERVVREIERAKVEESDKLESYLIFLYTTASYAPFIGLFGTVWGILSAFWKIGKMGSSNLAVVGPYIAESLVATAVGLAAAIPAVIFYNYYNHRLTKVSQELDFFSEDLSQRLKKEYGAPNPQ
jgi:biopolymer transport protein TolQ